MKSYTQIIYLALVIASLSIGACSKNAAVDPSSTSGVSSNAFDGEGTVTLNLTCKSPAPLGTGTHTTYRAQLFYRNPEKNLFNANKTTPMARIEKMYAPYTGTYRKPDSSEGWFIPCEVNTSDFSWKADDSSYGLKAGGYHNYYMVISSPATDYVMYDCEDVINIESYGPQVYKHEFWGIPYARSGEDYLHPAISDPDNVNISGELTNNAYVYNVPEAIVLKQQLARIYYGVRCGDALNHINLFGLNVTNLRSKAIFDPMLKEFIFSDDPTDTEASVLVYQSSNPLGERLDRAGSEGSYSAGETIYLTNYDTAEYLTDYKDNSHYISMLSAKYSAFSTKDRPAIVLSMKDDSGKLIVSDPMEVAFDYDSQKSYYYVITVNSMYIAVAVTVSDWMRIENGIPVDDYKNDEDHLVSLTIIPWDSSTLSGKIDGEGGGGGETETAEVTIGSDVQHWNNHANTAEIGDDLDILTPDTEEVAVEKGFYSLTVENEGEYIVTYKNESGESYTSTSSSYIILFYSNNPQTLYDGTATRPLEAKPYTLYVSSPGKIRFTKQ